MDLSTPLDKNSRCASAICRGTDNKCGCTSNIHCSSGEACHLSDNKCYTSNLSYGESCLVNGDQMEARCASGICFEDNTCGCISNDHCSLDQACYSSVNGDNKCYPLPSSVLSSTSCAISGVDSDGSVGDLIAAQNGNLIIIDSNGTITDVSAQFARGNTTVIEDINYFIIPAGQTVNVLGTLIVKAKRTQIDGELNGSEGGYAGGVSPPDTNGHGKNGMYGGRATGGGGGSHGKLLFLNCLF